MRDSDYARYTQRLERRQNDLRRFERLDPHPLPSPFSPPPPPPTPYKSPELRFVLFLGKVPLKLTKLVGFIPYCLILGVLNVSLRLHGRKGLWYKDGGFWNTPDVPAVFSPGIKKGMEWRDEFNRG